VIQETNNALLCGLFRLLVFMLNFLKECASDVPAVKKANEAFHCFCATW